MIVRRNDLLAELHRADVEQIGVLGKLQVERAAEYGEIARRRDLTFVG